MAIFNYFKKIKIKLYSLINWYFNLSLYWKVGFVIGSCFFINLFIAFYFSYLFNHAVKLYKEISYHYEMLIDKALIYSQEEKLFFRLRNNLLLLITELEKEKRFPQIQPQVENLRKIILKPSLNFDDIQNINKELVLLKSFFLNERLDLEKKLSEYEKHFKYLKFLLLLSMILFLSWGTWAFYYMVKKPLDRILEKLTFLVGEKEHKGLTSSKICVLEYAPKDEIGKIITKLNEILSEYASLIQFKRTIENEETSALVYERLGDYLKYSLNIENFIIYQVSNSQNTMTPVYVSNPKLEIPSEIRFDADKCRAKRTGEIINSTTFFNICKVFPLKDLYAHYCIPMNYGGKCTGVVAIYFPKEKIFENFEIFEKSIIQAQIFIRETTPVIEAKRYAEILKEQTFKDPMTALYNRRFLEATLENLTAQILRRESILGILMCDLDFFKSVNDRYGHDAGDFILRETANLLASNVRKSDMVIRFGGEEFLVLLIDVKEGESVKVAEKLRSLIESHEFKIPQGIIKKTISIGVSEFPIDTSNIWEAIKFADVALYKAKEFGRNRVIRFKKEFWTEESY